MAENRSPAASFTHPILRRVASGLALGADSATARPRPQVDVDAHDVCLPGGDGEHPLAASADDERGVGALDRAGQQRVLGDRVVRARERERPVARQQPLEHRHTLGEALHPHRRCVVGDAGLLVVAAHPPRTHAELEAAVAQQVHGGGLLGQHERMAVVVVEHEGPHPEPVGGARRRHQGGHGGELVPEVVGHEQGGVAEVLRLAGLFGPRAGRRLRPLGELGGEAERTGMAAWGLIRSSRSGCRCRGSPLRGTCRGCGGRPRRRAGARAHRHAARPPRRA